eukprot:2842512-Amphidinium_carterae.2
MKREEWHRNNMDFLQQLDETELGRRYQEHITASARFLARVKSEQGGVPDLLVGTPAPEPTIIGQTKRRIEFEDVDLVLVNQETTQQQVPGIMLTEGTVLDTVRIRGIAKENPLKEKKRLGVQGLLTPDRIHDITIYVDYLKAKGIASESAIQYPTREWFREHLLVPSSHLFTQVDVQTMGTEGVDLEKRKMNKVDGMWIFNGYLLKDSNEKMVRHVKLLEVPTWALEENQEGQVC